MQDAASTPDVILLLITMSDGTSFLSRARYGKDKLRVLPPASRFMGFDFSPGPHSLRPPPLTTDLQATLYRMARLIIAQNAHVQTVSYALPNKHYIPVDMGYLGVKNLVLAQADVFIPGAHPFPLRRQRLTPFINATVSRK
ncbi:hypothetical protein B0H14DRAFT_3866218 [Mycena olivaceomarginata]|nr:hypothetical protein B0H14DRAFT_3866218 [Mycena olivaceomarginata]